MAVGNGVGDGVSVDSSVVVGVGVAFSVGVAEGKSVTVLVATDKGVGEADCAVRVAATCVARNTSNVVVTASVGLGNGVTV